MSRDRCGWHACSGGNGGRGQCQMRVASCTRRCSVFTRSCKTLAHIGAQVLARDFTQWCILICLADSLAVSLSVQGGWLALSVTFACASTVALFSPCPHVLTDTIAGGVMHLSDEVSKSRLLLLNHDNCKTRDKTLILHLSVSRLSFRQYKPSGFRNNSSRQVSECHITLEIPF